MEQEYLPGDTPQQRLQDLMKEYKITQAELASKIGVAESSISRFLNGTKNKLTIEQIISIARIFNVSSDFLLCLTNVPDKKNYNISELGLSAEAARNLYTGRVNPEVVSRLLENRRFAQLTSMIALYFDETMASGFAAQNQILQSLSSMLLMTGKEQPDVRKASQQAAQAVSLNKVPVFQADLSNIQNQFMAVLREIKKEMTSGEGISQNMTKELTEQMFSELTKGQDLHHPSVSPEQLAAMVVQPISQMGLAEDESLAELQQALLHMMESMQPMEVGAIKYKNGALQLNANKRITGISQEVWKYQIGGHQVLDKWFKEHKGEALTIDSFTHIENIVGALDETIKLREYLRGLHCEEDSTNQTHER